MPIFERAISFAFDILRNVGWKALFAAGAIIVALVHCKYGVYEQEGPYDAGTIAPLRVTIAAGEAKRVEFDDGNFVVQIPAGATTQPTTFTIFAYQTSAGGFDTDRSARRAYGVLPVTNFAKPVSVFLRSTKPVANDKETFLGISTNRTGPFNALPLGGSAAGTFFGLSMQIQYHALLSTGPSPCANTPACTRSCCGTVAPVQVNGAGFASVMCPGVANAQTAADCMQSACPALEGIGQACQQQQLALGGLQSCNNCDPSVGCCAGVGQSNGCGRNECTGVLLKCDDAGDCGNGQLCCLERNAQPMSAVCKSECAVADRLCQNGSECGGGGTCAIPGSGCAFNMCSPAPIPGVCP